MVRVLDRAEWKDTLERRMVVLRLVEQRGPIRLEALGDVSGYGVVEVVKILADLGELVVEGDRHVWEKNPGLSKNGAAVGR